MLDNWKAAQGLQYLVGIDEMDYSHHPYTYDSHLEIKTLEPSYYDEREQPHITEAFKNKLDRIIQIWDSGNHPEFNPPGYYVNWAISKNLEVPWLDYAMEKGFFKLEHASHDVAEHPSIPISENGTRREIQHEIILAVIAALGFDALNIPDGGKARIKSVCLTRPRFFTPDSFDHAWKSGSGADLFRMANHEKFSPR